MQRILLDKRRNGVCNSGKQNTADHFTTHAGAEKDHRIPLSVLVILTKLNETYQTWI